jgi:hypothetical protein
VVPDQPKMNAMAGTNLEVIAPERADVQSPPSIWRHAIPVLMALLLLVAAAALITYGITVRDQATDARTRTGRVRALIARSDLRAETSSRTLTSLIGDRTVLADAISTLSDAQSTNVQDQDDLTTAGNQSVDQYNAGNVGASNQTVRTTVTSAADTFDGSLRDFQAALAAAGVALAKLEAATSATP